MKRMRPKLRTIAIALMSAVLAVLQLPGGPVEEAAARTKSFDHRPHVVVATLDTGTNPFHPTWRRHQFRHPSRFIPGFPESAPSLELEFKREFADSVTASKRALDEMAKRDRYPYWIPGTNIIGAWASPGDQAPIFDLRPNGTSHSHGAHASSQISGKGYGMAPWTYLVIMDRTPDGGGDVYQTNAEGLRWAADQPWIDIIHTNIQNIVPLANGSTPAGFTGYPEAVSYALRKGKIVVSAGGNWFVEPTETSPHAGPPGVLVAGANDNCGYTDFSNPDPHVVMDGMGTVSADFDSYEDDVFSGTSSASPRITGYVAKLLLRIRRHFDYSGGIQDGALVVLDRSQRPKKGPLADGKLVAAELQEVVRKTADPNPHESRWDGAGSLECIPQPVDLPYSFYPKMGYGEISEHTIGSAFEAAIGQQPMPERPMEDDFYEASEEARRAFWEE